MVHVFGDYRLDADARTLTFREQPVAVQPLVFDLIACLVANGGRVVPKEELLDRLWPGVHVTEASLQRAVSLARAALRPGGMDAAIRTYPRFGYRFCPDEPGLGGLDAAAAADVAEDPPETAAALGRRDWPAAAEAFAAADAAAPLGPDALDRWALALECCGRPADAIPLLVRAVAGHAEAGVPARAARAAVTLARLHLERGEMALARGWLARAEALLSSAPEGAIHGLWHWMRSRLDVFEGRPEAALAAAEEAARIAAAQGDAGLEALARAYCGFYRLCLGETARGVAEQDHAAAMALSAPIDPVTGALVYCAILWSCRGGGDWRRAAQWSAGFESWCHAGLADMSGACRLHRAELMGQRGTLAAARAEAEAAIARLHGDEPWAVGDAWRVLGDIRAAEGDTSGARAAYAEAHAAGWDGEPGHAMLLLAEGDGDGALAALDRVLAGRGWWPLHRQGLLRAQRALVLAKLGRGAEARPILDELAAGSERWPSPAVRATAAEAESALAAGDPTAAAAHLARALALWQEAGADYQAARVRLDLAAARAAAGDAAGAALDRSAGLAAAARMGAGGLIARAGSPEFDAAVGPIGAARRARV
jgi:DNA-binding winged helix-turn-helix (wHTH) protein